VGRAASDLVCIETSGTQPSGSGWTQLTADSDSGDTIYVWPDNPGGLEAFSFPSPQDAILLEFSGPPPSVRAWSEGDTGYKTMANVASLSVEAPSPPRVGTLELLYLDSGGSSSASETSMAGWTYVGTDSNNNFAWWRAGTVAPATGNVSVSPPSQLDLLLAVLN